MSWLADRLLDRGQTWSRNRKADWISHFIRARSIETVLIVGAGPRRRSWEGIIERRIESDVATVVSVDVTGHSGPGLFVVADGCRLPFRDGQFDLVYSNAVVEHVGDADAQLAFVAEHSRVGRFGVLTTPNRWFPVEPHTRVLGRHWSRRWRERQTRFSRLLSPGEFAALGVGTVVGGWWSPTLTGVVVTE